MNTETDVLSGRQIRLFPMYPLSVVLGGFELQCLKTHAALEELGIAAKLLDYYDADDEYDILHLFSQSSNYYDLVYHASGKCRVVVSAISGAGAGRWRGLVWSNLSRVAGLGRLQTTYSRSRFVLQRAAAVICLNRLEAQFLHATYGVPWKRIHIVSNGVEEHYFGASGQPFIDRYGIQDFVLFTGNIVERKNPLRLARVLRGLAYPGVFIGGTMHAEQAYAEAFAEVVDSTPCLRWIPRLAHDDGMLASAYAAARVFCLPSVAETQSLSALEAMAAVCRSFTAISPTHIKVPSSIR